MFFGLNKKNILKYLLLNNEKSFIRYIYVVDFLVIILNRDSLIIRLHLFSVKKGIKNK